MNRMLSPLWVMSSTNNSGTAFANRNLASGMTKVGAAPYLFVTCSGECTGDFEMAGAKVRVFPHLGRLLLGRSATREATNLKVSLVHALSPDMLKRAERLARALDVPLFVTVNRLEENEIASMKDYRGQGVVAVSTAIRERIVNAAGLPQQRIRVIHNGLDLSRMPRPYLPEPGASVASDPAVPWRAPVIGTLGQLAEKKGQRVFLQAVKLLLDRGLDAEFVILGDGPDRPALRSLADKLNVAKRVTFTPQTVSGQLTQLDILVEPSLQEGLGVSVMQAMAMGVPVVATGVGGLYDLIEDGRTGVMVPANAPEALADAIWRLLHNPTERIELARQARAMIERDFSAEHVAQQLLTYYQESLDGFGGWDSKTSQSARLYRRQ